MQGCAGCYGSGLRGGQNGRWCSSMRPRLIGLRHSGRWAGSRWRRSPSRLCWLAWRFGWRSMASSASFATRCGAGVGVGRRLGLSVRFSISSAAPARLKGVSAAVERLRCELPPAGRFGSGTRPVIASPAGSRSSRRVDRVGGDRPAEGRDDIRPTSLKRPPSSRTVWQAKGRRRPGSSPGACTVTFAVSTPTTTSVRPSPKGLVPDFLLKWGENGF